MRPSLFAGIAIGMAIALAHDAQAADSHSVHLCKVTAQAADKAKDIGYTKRQTLALLKASINPNPKNEAVVEAMTTFIYDGNSLKKAEATCEGK